MVSALTQRATRLLIHIFNHSASYLLSGYDVLTTTPGAENSSVNKADGSLFSQNFHFTWERQVKMTISINLFQSVLNAIKLLL